MATTVYQKGNGMAPAGQGFNPQQANGGVGKATIYPGMQSQPQTNGPVHNTPIAGFFYSVSRTAAGEFWPIFEGPNLIGRGESSVVKLVDPQVSDKHATLVVRPMMSGNAKTGILVYIQDEKSTCGTMLNGNTLGFDPKECHHGDVITIGPNYELYLILVDAATLGLTQKEALQNLNPIEPTVVPPVWGPQSGVFTGGSPKGTILQNGPQQGGNNPLSASGATVCMPNK